jgi:hypothetical protein
MHFSPDLTSVAVAVVSREFTMHTFFDCNNNGVADDLDIIDENGNLGVSLDLDENFIPDECVNFVADANNLWSCPDNWENLAVFPDNDNGGPFTPTLDEDDDAFLDVDVTLNSLSIVDNAILRVNQIDPDGDLTIGFSEGGPQGGILVDGTLQIGEDRVIDSSAGPVVVGIGGRYEAVPAQAVATGTLHTEKLTLLEGPPGQAAVMTLTGQMVVDVGSDFLITGPTDPTDGDCTPLDFAVLDNSEFSITGQFEIEGAVVLFVQSTKDVALGGHMINKSTGNEIFDWEDGGLTLFGSSGTTHEIEAAGRNLGDLPAGLDTNFAMGRLEVQQNNELKVVDVHDNDELGSGACAEALYVEDLQLRNESEVTLSNASLYYVRLQDDGGTMITQNGCEFGCIRFPHGDVNEDGLVDVDDILCALNGFANPSSCPGSDIMPCAGGDSMIDLTDIMSLMDAFTGSFDCTDACL